MLSRPARLVFSTLLPAQAHPTLPVGLLNAGFDDFWLDFERTALPSLRWAVRGALLTAIWVSPLLIGRLPPLGLYDQPTREQALRAMAGSRSNFLRQMLQLLKTTACFCYGADRSVRAAIGYPLQPDDPGSTLTP